MLEVVSRVVTMGQDDGDRMPVSWRPPGVDVWGDQHLDHPSPTLWPNPVEQLRVVSYRLLHLEIGEDPELLSNTMLTTLAVMEST